MRGPSGFDSWRSEWNGHYFNAYYGKNNMQMYDGGMPHSNSHF